MTTLSPRDLAVLRYAADGVTVAATARKLDIAPGSIGNQRMRIVAAMGARNITHAVAIAIRKGLIP